MAAALFEAHLRRMGADAAISSAGLLEDGWPATDYALAAMANRGIDATSHRSRRLTGEMVGKADLLVGMAREHVREAVAANPDVGGRAFTLKELVRRGEQVGARRAGQPLGEWLAAMHGGRRPADLFGESPDDDVPDPIGQRRSAYEATEEVLKQFLVPKMFAAAARGEMGPEEAVWAAETQMKPIFEKWRQQGKI